MCTSFLYVDCQSLQCKPLWMKVDVEDIPVYA
uniref:Uncharacterized protein n=1 Tax=Vitis vinifera TaxID=29760 RepID=F6HTW2_VITVI